MKLKVRDIVSHQGKDYVVEGLVTYSVGGKTYPLARTVEGARVAWIEPLMDELDDRILLFSEVKDLEVGTPPPPTISYKGKSYLPRFGGAATVTVDGKVSDRKGGSCEVWRYRAAGDVFLQIEKWPDKVVVLAGESIHTSMFEVLPGA